MYTKLIAVPWYGLAALSGIAAAQPVIYDSAYADYQAYVEEPVSSWREVNDVAARVGGHAGIFGGSMHQGHGAGKPAQSAPGSARAAETPPAGNAPPPAPHRGGHH